jgi:hypothetical protein
MTYNNNNFASNGGIGLPTAGFASRGKAPQLKRLSLASPPKFAPIGEDETVSTPRTSRSHLLAGLRTAPKTPTTVPSSAPFNQATHRIGMQNSRFADNLSNYGHQIPQTAAVSTFANAGYNNQFALNNQQMYSVPEQVLAPPSLFLADQDAEQMDPAVLARLMATERLLQQRKMQLEQQLANLNLAAQRPLALALNQSALLQQQFPATPLSPTGGMAHQFMNTSGLAPDENQSQYAVFNPMSGQYQYVSDPTQLGQLASSPPPPTPGYASSPPKANTPAFRTEISPPADPVADPFAQVRTITPPKKAPSPPQDYTPLPPPSANAFRRGHKKVSSLAFNSPNNEQVSDGPKSAIIPRVGFPQTPLTGTFGPGQARAGEHPVRQPRGPPPLEELQAAPTTKQEGSKNFASRQRRRAVNNLVRAGIERRGVHRSGSAGSMTPVSESEVMFSLSSDNDSDSGHSGSLSGKPSIGSLRAVASGAIGSERKESKDRSRDRSVDGGYSANSVSSDEGIIGGKLVEVKLEDTASTPVERRMMPKLVLTSAEKRKTAMY